MQIQTTVRLASVQKNGDGNDGDVSHPQRKQNHLPPSCL
jgi:hypothetical protein